METKERDLGEHSQRSCDIRMKEIPRDETTKMDVAIVEFELLVLVYFPPWLPSFPFTSNLVGNSEFPLSSSEMVDSPSLSQ